MISAISVTSNVKNVKMPAFRGQINVGSNGEGDTFKYSTSVADGNISLPHAEFLMRQTEDSKNLIGMGYTAQVYKIGSHAIKSPRKDFDDERWLHMANDKMQREYAILKEISAISPDITSNPSGLIKKDGVHHIVEEYIEGIHPYDMQIKEHHLKDLISKFTTLDKNGIFGSDLQSANMFFLKDGTARIIDFGSYSFLANRGICLDSDYIPPEELKNKGEIGLPPFAKDNIESRYAASFFNKNSTDVICDMKNYADNPYLNVKSNMANFEFRNLFTFLRDDYIKNPMEILRNYVKLKGSVYHSQMSDFLKNIKISDNLTSFTKVTVTEAQEDLKNAIHYEELAKEVLSNPTDDILKAEAAKIQLRMFFNPDSWRSSIPHEKGLQYAYNQLRAVLLENISKTEGKTKEYFEETLKGLDNRFKHIIFEPEQKDIPEKENLVYKLFQKDTTPEITDEVVKTPVKQEITAPVKTSFKKLKIASGIIACTLGGLFLYKGNKKQNKIKDVKTDNTNKTIKHQPKNNTNKTPNIFNSFA